MTLFDQIRRDHDRSPATGLKGFFRWLRHRLPTGIYARSLLIIILPMLILQTVVAFVFMERHWQLVTERLSEAVTRDIAAVIELLQRYPGDEDFSTIADVAASKLSLMISLEPGTELPSPRPSPFFSILDQILSDEIAEQIRRPFWIDTVGTSRLVEIRIVVDDRTLRIFAPRN
ncbi:MAG: two-component sensor histidine kinase, partial [Allorhizobium sp.]